MMGGLNDTKDCTGLAYTMRVSKDPIRRPALGQKAEMGGLYNIRTKQFLDQSLFSASLDQDDIDDYDDRRTSFFYTEDDKFKNKMLALGVDSDLCVDILCHMIEVSGSGKYLTDELTSARSQSRSLIYNISTCTEEININNKRTKKMIDLDILESTEATHVVVGIDWGATCVITCTDKNRKYEDKFKISEKLKEELAKIGDRLLDIKESISVNSENHEEDISDFSSRKTDEDEVSELEFNCVSDIYAEGEYEPITYKGVYQLARNMKKYVNLTDSGKGVPMVYQLIPLEAVMKKCRLSINIHKNYWEITEDTVEHVSEMISEVRYIEQLLNDLQYDIEDGEDYITPTILYQVSSLVDDFSIKENTFRSDLKDIIVDVRSQELSEVELLHYLTDVDSFETSFWNYKMNEYLPTLRKISEIHSWVNLVVNIRIVRSTLMCLI